MTGHDHRMPGRLWAWPAEIAGVTGGRRGNGPGCGAAGARTGVQVGPTQAPTLKQSRLSHYGTDTVKKAVET
jgi:hypothetical protein